MKVKKIMLDNTITNNFCQEGKVFKIYLYMVYLKFVAYSQFLK